MYGRRDIVPDIVLRASAGYESGASSANGIIGFVAYLSPLVSGLVFGHIADTSGWELVFKIMIVVAFIGLLTLLTLWNKKTDGYSTPESEN